MAEDLIIKDQGKLTYKFNKSSFQKYFDKSFEYLKNLPLYYLKKGNESFIQKIFFHYYNFYWNFQ